MIRKKKDNPVTWGKLKDVVATHSANLAASMPKPAGPPSLDPAPSKPAELREDAGGGYNANGAFPQR